VGLTVSANPVEYLRHEPALRLAAEFERMGRRNVQLVFAAQRKPRLLSTQSLVTAAL
jgi:hypothetical protein